MTQHEEDKRHAKNADQSLSFVQDMSRAIDARQPEVTRLSKPLKERRLRNHFIQEAEEMYRGGYRNGADTW
jgi:hypothetical protein